MKETREAAFYAGKISSAKYFIKNILPEVGAAAKAIKSKDMSVMEIAEKSFAW
ncbi:MAG: acyl-CoA dehydrogenase C-terminal domain-containing protein [Desulfobacteraceae bacterium]|nr:acyl-CoA dehydrogenase C-terminal domain-containing protein [Desulfobacteraceae bacterium]